MIQFPTTFPRASLEASATAKAKRINNTCPDSLLPNLAELAWTLDKVENALQAQYGKNAKLSVNCAYRCDALNTAVGGSPTSAHRLAFAADITCNVLNPYQLAVFISKMNLPFDQIIQEFGRWVHLGLAKTPRKQLLTARKVDGKTVYLRNLMPA